MCVYDVREKQAFIIIIIIIIITTAGCRDVHIFACRRVKSPRVVAVSCAYNIIINYNIYVYTIWEVMGLQSSARSSAGFSLDSRLGW